MWHALTLAEQTGYIPHTPPPTVPSVTWSGKFTCPPVWRETYIAGLNSRTFGQWGLRERELSVVY